MKEEFKFSVKGKEWEELQETAFDKLNKKAKIDGFRPGKAPRSMYEKKYGVQEILYEAADMAIGKEYKRLISAKKLMPVIEPKVDLVKCDKQELEVKFIFVSEPEVELGEYTNLNVSKDKVKVSKEEIEKRIDSLRDNYAELEVKEGPLADGDIAIIDYTGYKDGEKFEGGEALNYSLTIGSKTFIPGFEEALIGMNKGEEKDVNLTFPKDYMDSSLKGKDVVFKVKLNEIKTRVVPSLDKDFFQDLGISGVDTKEKLEKEVKKEITEQKEKEIEHIYTEKCLEKASVNMKVNLCDELIENEIEYMYKEFMERMKMQGITEEMYYQYTKSKKEDVTSQMKEDALKRLKYRYLLKAIIKKEKITATDKEVKDRIEEMAKMYNVSSETILKEVSEEDIKFDKIYQKALDLVCKNEEKTENK